MLLGGVVSWRWLLNSWHMQCAPIGHVSLQKLHFPMLKVSPMRLPIALVVAASLLVTSPAAAQTIFLGNDTRGPVQRYSTAGVFLGLFGQSGATGSALDGIGHVWTVAPAFGDNHIEMYDASQNVLNTFTATVDGNWIEDMAHGGGNSLWAGTFEGNIFNINATTGATNSSFAVANSSFTGVAFDGTNLWATGGLAGNDNIYQLATDGTLLNTIHTGFNDGMGIGYLSTDNTLWIGYQIDNAGNGEVRQFSLGGTLISNFDAIGFAHDGLEIGDIGSTSSVPEPASVTLLATGLVGIYGAARRRRKAASAA